MGWVALSDCDLLFCKLLWFAQWEYYRWAGISVCSCLILFYFSMFPSLQSVVNVFNPLRTRVPESRIKAWELCVLAANKMINCVGDPQFI